jgi:TPR repeat protein
MSRKHWISVLLAYCVLAASSASHAAPEDDYRIGLKSFQDGDVIGAMNVLRKSADAGHAKSQVLLAEVLDRAELNEEALSYYRKAADQGDPDGMFGYGAMLAAGEGLKAKDLVEGRRWILKAAEQGHTQAVSVMGHAYLKGDLGLTENDRNTPEALHWVEQAAKVDYLPAVDALVDAYRTGIGLPVTANVKLADDYLAQANRLRGIDPSKKKKKGRRVPASSTSG